MRCALLGNVDREVLVRALQGGGSDSEVTVQKTVFVSEIRPFSDFSLSGHDVM